MKVELCDGGCGKRSPDEDNLYVGNGWFEVSVLDRRLDNPYTDRTEHHVFCRECFDRIKGAMASESRATA